MALAAASSLSGGRCAVGPERGQPWAEGRGALSSVSTWSFCKMPPFPCRMRVMALDAEGTVSPRRPRVVSCRMEVLAPR